MKCFSAPIGYICFKSRESLMARHFGIKEKEQHLLFNPMFSFTFLYFCVT